MKLSWKRICWILGVLLGGSLIAFFLLPRFFASPTSFTQEEPLQEGLTLPGGRFVSERHELSFQIPDKLVFDAIREDTSLHVSTFYFTPKGDVFTSDQKEGIAELVMPKATNPFLVVSVVDMKTESKVREHQLRFQEMIEKVVPVNGANARIMPLRKVDQDCIGDAQLQYQDTVYAVTYSRVCENTEEIDQEFRTLLDSFIFTL